MDDTRAAETLVATLTKELEEHRQLGERDGHSASWIKRELELEAELRRARLDLEVIEPG